MYDRQHNGRGFYDIEDVESIVRAIQQDAGDRLYNSIQIREGKMCATAQVERDLHNQIMMMHMYIKPFQSVQELVRFIHDYKPANEDQACVKSLLIGRVPALA